MSSREWGWILYDWGNSAYATTVLAAFFPLFFKQYWCGPGFEVTESTALYARIGSIASLVIFLSAPILGSIADRGGLRKVLLLTSALLGALSTMALLFVGQGDWLAASILYVVSQIGFSGSLVFYDSMIVDVTTEDRYDRISLLGYGFGYLGGGVLYLLNIVMTLKPELFGFADIAAAIKWSFVSVGAWWLVFTIPLLLLVKEKSQRARPALSTAIRLGVRQFVDTFYEIKKLKVLFLFLIGYMFYIDAVNSIIRMSADYASAIGLENKDVMLAFLIVQFVGFPAAFLFIRLVSRLGAIRGIYVCLVIYVGITFWAYGLQHAWEFFTMAVIIALVQGGIQALSRSHFATLIPDKSKSAEFFGFYNTMGKAAAVFGPLLMGETARLTGNPRAGILPLLGFFLIGALLLRKSQQLELTRK